MMDAVTPPSSMFRSSKSGSSPLLPHYEHELPLLDSSSRLSYGASRSPSLAPSIYDLTASSMAPTKQLSPLTALQRKEKQLQHDLQGLLDAQSEGLIAGLADAPPDDVSSNGSLTPTASVASGRATRVVPVRQPVQKKIGLQSARRGILSAIHELVEIKGEEAQIFENDVGKREEVLAQVDGWDHKRKGLETQIEGIQSSEEGRRMPELSREAGKVEAEIKELETRLYEMRAKHRVLTAEISQIENSVQSKLSSYKASLSIMNSQVRKFLAKPPLSANHGTLDESSLFSFPANRRTLDMAREHWQAERVELANGKEEVEVERDALEDGAVVWNDVVTEVTTFERRLRLGMHRIGPPSQTTPSDYNHPDDPADSMIKILRDMDQAILQIESKLKLAEARDWKLLVCCIGAELEAFREGKEILQEALDTAASQSTHELPSRSDAEGVSLDDDGRNLDEVLNYESDVSREQTLKRAKGAAESDDDDDEPDPELLISHQDSN